MGQHRISMRDRQVDCRMLGLWCTGLVFLVVQFAVNSLVKHQDKLIWPIVTNWSLLAVFSSFCGLYVRKYFVKNRMSWLTSSPLVWEIMALLTMNMIVSILWTKQRFFWQEIAANLLMWLGMSLAPVLDSCDSSPLESKVSLLITASACILTIVGNQMLWSDQIIHEGFGVHVDAQNRTVRTGQVTLGGLKTGCMTSLLALLLGSLYTAFFHDQGAELMYFVKLEVHKDACGTSAVARQQSDLSTM